MGDPRGANEDSSASSDLTLLDKVEAMLQVERSLSRAIDKSEPWLEGAVVHSHRRRVRPVPQSMEQVQQVLSYARVLSSRTSAPAGWNPSAPVVGFSTPNPLPHQLRGGVLAALQLERARQKQINQAQKIQKRRHKQEQLLNKNKEDATTKTAGGGKRSSAEDDDQEGTTSSSARDPKRRDVAAHQQQDAAGATRPPPAPTTAATKAARPATSQLDVSMNLSSDEDSSSEDDDD